MALFSTLSNLVVPWNILTTAAATTSTSLAFPAAFAMITSSSRPSSGRGGGFVLRSPTSRSTAAMTTSTPTMMRATRRKKRYAAEWIDLLSPESYPSSSHPPSPILPGRIDPPRSGGVSFVTPDGAGLFAFAGYAEVVASPTTTERYVVNDLWRFLPHPQRRSPPDDDGSSSSSSSWGWTEACQKGDYVPPVRLASALAVLPSSSSGTGTGAGEGARAVLLGGWDPRTPGSGGVILDDVSFLDVDDLVWSRPVDDDVTGDVVTTIPGGPTSRHVAVRLSIRRDDDDDDDDDAPREDVVCLHNHRCVDHVLLLSSTKDGRGSDDDDAVASPAVARWDRVATTGDAPSSRGLHCAATINRSRSMVIFGGAAKDGIMSNEAFVLDAKTWTWTRLNCGGGEGGGEEVDGVVVAPVPRAGACLCPLDDDSVLLFGGASPGEGGLVGMNDVWVLTIDAEGGRGEWDCLIPHRDADDNDDNDDGGDDDALRPPGRNAATLSAIDGEKLLPDDIVWKSGSSMNDGKERRYFLLNGGWYPFRKTYNDIFLLRISTESDSNSVE